MKNPYMKFFVGDWIRDTRMMKEDEKGVWIDLLAFMHSNEECGFIEGTWEEIARLVGINDEAKCKQIVSKIAKKGICDLEQISIQNESNDETVRIVNRRMFQAFLISQKRSKAGKAGGEKSQAKRKQNESFLNDNVEAKTEQNCGSGSGNGIIEEKGGTGEKETTGGVVDPGVKVLLVPELIAVWKSSKPDYVVSNHEDFPAVRQIAEMIAKAKAIEDYTSFSSVDAIKQTFSVLVDFSKSHSLYKDFQLSQFAKYFNAIASACKNSLQPQEGAKSANGKASIIDNNLKAANEAREYLKQKYGNT